MSSGGRPRGARVSGALPRSRVKNKMPNADAHLHVRHPCSNLLDRGKRGSRPLLLKNTRLTGWGGYARCNTVSCSLNTHSEVLRLSGPCMKRSFRSGIACPPAPPSPLLAPPSPLPSAVHLARQGRDGSCRAAARQLSRPATAWLAACSWRARSIEGRCAPGEGAPLAGVLLVHEHGRALPRPAEGQPRASIGVG